MGTDNFFVTPQGAAIMKHAVLGPYIRLFVNKLGSTHETVHYLDGYAGPGVYGDGSHGSPKLAVDVAELVDDIRDLRCTFVEQDRSHAAALTKLMATELPSASVICGDLRNHIATVAAACDDAPLLAFLDPFGLGIDFRDLETLTTSRTNKKTDVIMNVSLSALRRVGGQLFAKGTNATYLKARDTMIQHMDEVLDGDWWHDVLAKARRRGSDQGAIEIAHGYAERCQRLRGGYFLAEIKDRWDGPPAYMLLLLAGHRDAFWNFNEFVSLAQEKLRGLDPDQADLLLPIEDDYPPVLRENVLGLLKSHAKFTLEEQLGLLFGSLLGTARGTHLRPVIKALHEEGMLNASSRNAKRQAVTGGKGDLQHMVIARP